MRIDIGDICLFNTANKVPEVGEEINLLMVIDKNYIGPNRGYIVLRLNNDFSIASYKQYCVPFSKKWALHPIHNPNIPNVVVRYPPDLPAFDEEDVAVLQTTINVIQNMGNEIAEEAKDDFIIYTSALNTMLAKIKFYADINKKKVDG